MDGETLVYDEWDRALVPSKGHGGRFYRVFYGSVSWTRQVEDMKAAIVVLMQDDDTSDFEEAKSRGVLNLIRPAHILVEDLPLVMASIDGLLAKNRRMAKRVASGLR